MIIRIYGKWLCFLKRFYLKVLHLGPIMSYCRSCGKRVYDYQVPDKIWKKVANQPEGGGIYCYDCFCELSDKKGIFYRL